MVTCTKCAVVLKKETVLAAGLTPCHSCGALLQVAAFPALLARQPALSAAERILTSDEAGCFYHPTKRAVICCTACGRFLCSLCDVEFGQQHLCPACLSAGKRKKKLTTLENHRILYDNIALALAVFPLLVWVFTIVTAPAVIVVAARYWKSPLSIVPRTKVRFVLAVLLAGLQITGWSWLVYSWVAS